MSPCSTWRPASWPSPTSRSRMPWAPPSPSRASRSTRASRPSRGSLAPTTDRSRSPGEKAAPRCRAPFDAVVMATGWPADVEGLGLDAAGVQTVRSAIPVDQYFRSSVPHIYAVGDANGRDMLVQAAHFEGEAAAENAVLDANRRTPHHLLPSGGLHRSRLRRCRAHRGRGSRPRPEVHRRVRCLTPSWIARSSTIARPAS